jgi:hypothetical protein
MARRDAGVESDDLIVASGNENAFQREPLLPPEESGDLWRRWETIQTSFVDEPRRSVEEADALVGDVMKRIDESFSNRRQGLEGQWNRGEETSTEELRLALQRYRSFFERLLTT